MAGSLETHRQTQHDVGRSIQWVEALEEAQSYRLYFPRIAGSIACSFLGCGGESTNISNLRIKLLHCHHVRDMLVILEKGNRTHPQCPNCDIFVPWSAFNRCHMTTEIFAWGTARKCRRLVEDEAR